MTFAGILLAILAFGFLIFIHELGHFIAAKKAGVKVNEFSLGMGPAIFKYIKGETQYSLRLLPIGGFVAMEGEEEESSDSRSFNGASIKKRAIITSAGAIMNLILGFLVMALLTFIQLSADDALIPTTTIAKFNDNAITSEWLQEGDSITSVNGKKTKSYNDMLHRLLRDDDGAVDLTVVRDNKEIKLSNISFITENIEGMEFINIDFKVKGEDPVFLKTLGFTWDRTKFMTRQIWSGFSDIITGRVGFEQLSGPIGITEEMSRQTSTGDWESALLFISMLSLNLGIFNMLPFPALDGGRLLFLIIELVRKKPIKQKYEMIVNLVGISLLLFLMLAVTFKDVIGLFK